MADVRGGGTPVVGDTPHDSADAGYPIKTGGKASSAVPTAVTDGDRVNQFYDLYGRKVIAQKAATATSSNVNDSATNVTVLAANAARLGASIHNDSTEILYLKLGATATTTSYTVRMVAQAHYEVPYGYTGIIDGIWAANGSGAARVTEYT